MPLLDARRGEVYAAVYGTWGEYPSEIIAPFATTPESLAGRVPESGAGRDLFVCGPGLDGYRELLEESFAGRAIFDEPGRPVPAAGLASALALGRPPVPYDRLSSLEPVYVRPPDAKLPPTAKLVAGGGAWRVSGAERGERGAEAPGGGTTGGEKPGGDDMGEGR